MKRINGKGYLGWLFVVIGAVCLFSGCAGYTITKGGDGNGYDVYRPEPYLLVKPSGDAQIVWLPNYKERYRISTWNFLAKSDFDFKFDDGWRLTGIADKSDNTAIASKLLDAAQKAVKAETVALTGQVALYRLEYNEKGEFKGLSYMPMAAPQKGPEEKKK